MDLSIYISRLDQEKVLHWRYFIRRIQLRAGEDGGHLDPGVSTRRIY